MAGEHNDPGTALRDAALSLIWQDSVQDAHRTVEALVRAAVATVPGVEAGAVGRIEQGVVRSTWATTPAIGELDALQTELGEGPAITSAQDSPDTGVIHVRDLRGPGASTRWPAFAPRAVELGFRSVLSVGLVGERPLATLDLYGAHPGVFDANARLIAARFASQIAAALHGSEDVARLGRGPDTRDLLGQAQGIVMERFGLGPDSAFLHLVKASQDTDMRLTAVAQWLVDDAGRREAQNRAVARPEVDADTAETTADTAAQRSAEPA